MGSQTAAFVGREPELTVLLELGARVGPRGGPVAALVLGDPGSGKSRLVAEASDRIRLRQQFRIVGFEPARQVPLAAGSDLLRAITAAPRDGPRLRELLYETPTTSGPMEPLRIFEAAHRALRTFGPALIIADDLQWADEQTLALCQYLMRAAQTVHQPIGLLVASRQSPQADALLASLEQLLPRESLTSLGLEPLSRDEGVRLATELAPGLQAERAARVWAQAQGSPFWIEALVRSDGDPPVGNIMSARLRGLDADSTNLFAVLCVGGLPIGVADLPQFLSWEPSRVDRAVVQLINHGVIVQKGAALVVAHDLIREAAMRQLPLPERRRIHRQLAAWLEEDASDDIGLLRLALEHRHAGGLPTVALALRLARAPNRCLLGAEGLRELATIADEAKPGDGETLRLHHAVAALALEMSEWSVALDRFAMLSQDLAEPADRARAAYGAATAAFELRRAEVVHVYLADCLQSGDPQLATEAESLKALTVGWLENRLTEAKVHAAHAAERARQLVAVAGGFDALTPAERQVVVSGLRAAFDAAIWNDNVVEMLGISEELASAGRPLGEVALRATLDASRCYWPLGRFREGSVRFRRVLEEARRRVLPGIIAHASFVLAGCLFWLGRLAQARAHATEAVELSERGVLPARQYQHTEVRSLLYLIAASQKNWKHELQGLADFVTTEPNPHHRTAPRTWLVRALARFGGVEVADQVVREVSAAIKDVDAAGCERCRWDVTLSAIEAFARIGRRSEAEALATRWDTQHRNPYPFALFQRHHAEALLVARGGNVASAIPLFEAARGEAERMNLSLDTVWVELDLGEALALIDPERAIATLQAAAGFAETHGSESAQQRAGRMLRSLGVRTWKRMATPPGGPLPPLSVREHEIVRMVSGGASNPEIASALFLSRKTVEAHVSNLLRKLNVRNRTELASMFGRMSKGAHG